MEYIVLRCCLTIPIHKAFGEKKRIYCEIGWNTLASVQMVFIASHCILRRLASMKPMRRCPVERQESEMAGKIHKWKIDAQSYPVE